MELSVDTRNKRMSLIGFSSPVPTVLPNPDGTIASADRAMLLWLYHGIALSYVVAVIALTLPTRSLALTLKSRSLALKLRSRSLSLTLPTRE